MISRAYIRRLSILVDICVVPIFKAHVPFSPEKTPRKNRFMTFSLLRNLEAVSKVDVPSRLPPAMCKVPVTPHPRWQQAWSTLGVHSAVPVSTRGGTLAALSVCVALMTEGAECLSTCLLSLSYLLLWSVYSSLLLGFLVCLFY